MTHILSEIVFDLFVVCLVVLIYQSAILPGIRQSLRFRLFNLRDQLRQLVISGRIRENDKAFVLLHERLNFMCSNLPRFDLVNAVRLFNGMPQEEMNRVKSCAKVIDESTPEVKEIYEGAVDVIVHAIIFNSLFVFVLGVTGVGLVKLLEVGVSRLKDALVGYAGEAGRVAFFEANQVAV